MWFKNLKIFRLPPLSVGIDEQAQQDADKEDAELSPEEAAEFITAVDQFEECGETATDHATLMRWARIGLLECDHFTVTDKGDDFYRDAARAQQSGGK